MTINVLHLIDTDKACGPGRTVLESARALQDTEFRLNIAAYNYSRKKKNAYLDEVESEGFDQILIPIKNQFDPGVFSKLMRLIKENEIHILHTHGYKSDLFGLIAARLCRIKVVSTVHGWIQNNRRGKIYVCMDKYILRHFDRVIAVSGKIRSSLLQSGVPSEKVVIIHNAINLQKYSPDLAKPVLREELELSSQDNLLGIIGRLSFEKGQRDFLAAGKIILQKFPNCLFLLIGDGSDRHNLMDYARFLGIEQRVKFTGHRNDMVDIYQGLDIVVISSHTEGLPNVALEAMAMCKPVVATRVGGVPEIIDNGKTGLLVEPMNPEDIARSVGFLLENPGRRNKIIKNARNLIEKNFSFEQRMEKITKLYHALR